MTNQLCYFCCFLGAQDSGKVQHCDCGRVITKGLRQGAFTERCHPWRTIVITLQCHMFWSSPIKTNKTDCSSLFLNPSVILSCCSVTHLSLSPFESILFSVSIFSGDKIIFHFFMQGNLAHFFRCKQPTQLWDSLCWAKIWTKLQNDYLPDPQ